MNKEDLSNSERALSLFKEGFNCSQSITGAFAERLGLDFELALKISGGFGGGVGRTGQICGALLGAVIIIGIKYSPVKGDDKEARLMTYEAVSKLLKRFRSKNNSILCRELIECDFMTPEGYKLAIENKIIANRCPKFIKDVAEILEEVLSERG